jgi:3-oxoadipate enol-lactonase
MGNVFSTNRGRVLAAVVLLVAYWNFKRRAGKSTANAPAVTGRVRLRMGRDSAAHSLYYEIHTKPGASPKPRLLYIAGTNSDCRTVANDIDVAILSRYFDLLLFDHRGFGRSSAPQQVSEYSMHIYADDVVALLQQVGWDKCHVMGHSFGGMVAQEFALRHQEKVQRLVLAGTSSGGAGGSSYPVQDLPQDTAGFTAKALLLTDDRWNRPWNLMPEFVMRLLVRLLVAIQVLPVSPNEYSTEKSAYVFAKKAQLEARSSHNCWQRLPELRRPTLVVAGEHDKIAPLENSRSLAQRLPNSHLLCLPAGHLNICQVSTLELHAIFDARCLLLSYAPCHRLGPRLLLASFLLVSRHSRKCRLLTAIETLCEHATPLAIPLLLYPSCNSIASL